MEENSPNVHVSSRNMTMLIFICGILCGILFYFFYSQFSPKPKASNPVVGKNTPMPQVTPTVLSFTSSNIRYTQYIDTSDFQSDIVCLDNKSTFHRSDIQKPIDYLLDSTDTIEDESHKATLKEIKELALFFSLCQSQSLVKGEMITRYYYLFIPFDGWQYEKTKQFEKPLSFIPKAYAGGGMSQQPFIAYVDVNAKEQVLKRQISKREITSDITFIPHGETKQVTKGTAYFSFGNILGVDNSNNMYIQGGGGDGCCGAYDVAKVNLELMKGQEVFSCILGYETRDKQGGSTTHCVNSSGKVLKDTFTPSIY